MASALTASLEGDSVMLLHFHSFLPAELSTDTSQGVSGVFIILRKFTEVILRIVTTSSRFGSETILKILLVTTVSDMMKFMDKQLHLLIEGIVVPRLLSYDYDKVLVGDETEEIVQLATDTAKVRKLAGSEQDVDCEELSITKRLVVGRENLFDRLHQLV